MKRNPKRRISLSTRKLYLIMVCFSIIDTVDSLSSFEKPPQNRKPFKPSSSKRPKNQIKKPQGKVEKIILFELKI